MVETVNVTDEVVFASLADVTPHVPVAPVTHEALPDEPPPQLPTTVALATAMIFGHPAR